MGRRRWKFITIATFLLFIKDIQSQDDNNYFYTPVERSFAQIQPPVFPNNRSPSFIDQRSGIRVSPPAHQSQYDGDIRFPNPNYSQNPSPFQLPTGRSQSGNFYLNQPEFGTATRQRFRPSLPHNYQIIYTTKKPDVSQIHSAAYQNDPSRPETFLGQITINNPDIDYLQNNRFKNIAFDSNSLKSNGQSGLISHNEDVDHEDQEIFNNHKVTTYNPSRVANKQVINPKPSGSRFSHYTSTVNKVNSNSPNVPNVQNGQIKAAKQNRGNSPINAYQATSTESKALLDLEPLLEEDISDITTFRELMKHNKESYDVQVIKSNNSLSVDDSKPDASFMTTNNRSRDRINNHVENTTIKPITTTQHHVENKEHVKEHNYYSEEDEQVDENSEYYEDESTEEKYTTQEPRITYHTTEHTPDTYDEYDGTEESEKSSDDVENTSEPFHVLVMKNNKTMVKDDNFKQFTDTTAIDQSDILSKNDTIQHDNINVKSKEGITSIESPSILGEEIVSVVTTKSVVNGTISIPEITYPPSTEKIYTSSPASPILSNVNASTSLPITTENSVAVASVQTSRSVSGARFLPFPSVVHDDKKQTLDEENDEEYVTKNPKFDSDGLTNATSSTENINDKLDSLQSELSSGVLSGTIGKDIKHIELITEATPEQITTSSTTTTIVNVFTLKSTQPYPVTERSSPEPLPVTIKKFMPRVYSPTTPTPRRKIVTVMEDVSGLLPPGYKPKLSFKDKRTSTSTTTTSTTPKPVTIRDESFINGTQARSSGISSKNKVILLDDKSLLPKEYLPKEHRHEEDKLKGIKHDDINRFLPSDYKPPAVETSGDKESSKLKEHKFHTDDISKFLPPGYKSQSETNETKSKNLEISKIKVDDISKFLPPGYKPPAEDTVKKQTSNIDVHQFKKDDISKFLPPGYKQPVATVTESSKKIDNSKIKIDDISKLLPPGYKPPASDSTSKKETESSHIGLIKPVDISAFLPKGFNLNSTEKPVVDLAALLPTNYKLNNSGNVKETPITIKVGDISSLLPPGFSATEAPHNLSTTTTTKPSGGFKVVFPSRPGGKVVRKTTPKPADLGPEPVSPKILKGWPVRASTEFTGWPSPSTTPFSIEKLLEAQRNSTASGPIEHWTPDSTTIRTTTTTTTTTPAPPPSTTPGICRHECEIAATIKIVSGVSWEPALLDPHTEEWKRLAKEVKEELNSVYSKSDLKKWYKNIRIDGFSKGSVLVDYFVELNDVEDKVNTLELKKLFHETLNTAKPGSVIENVKETRAETFDPDVMVGDQPEEDRLMKNNEKLSKILDKSAGKLEIGKYIVDPAYTEFIVVQKREEPKIIEEPEEESLLPQWGIAVIVIAMASLLFVVIFGVTVLVNRQKNYKAKQPIPLSEDMLRELDKSHMGGFDDMHQMKERELPHLPSGKRASTAFIEQLAYPNPGDSWRSEWTPQLQKYMQSQHYAADSGRGSQTYGPVGNIYGYGGGSQLYGQTGGSQVYGYTGEYQRSHHSRRRSEYDSNF